MMHVIIRLLFSLSIIISVFIQISNAATVRKSKSDANCTNHLSIIDRCSSLAGYSFTTSFNQYPIDKIQMKSSCDRIPDGLKCLKPHIKCVKPILRRSLNVYSDARSKHSKRLCANLDDPKTIEFWKTFECMKGASKQKVMIANEKELISTLQLLAANQTMDWDDRFNQACCVASGYKKKVLKDIEPQCSKYRGVLEDLVNSMIGEFLDSLCPDSKRLNEICLKLPKLSLPTDWKAVSLTGVALDLIVSLANTPKQK